MAYKKTESYDEQVTEGLIKNYKESLALLGEDAEREGLLKTPERMAKAMQFLTQGYQQDASAILNGAKFREDVSEMVIVKDIELNSMGVAVVIEAKHLCMMMRGVQKQNSVTTTSAFDGEFLNNHITRNEFLKLIAADLS